MGDTTGLDCQKKSSNSMGLVTCVKVQFLVKDLAKNCLRFETKNCYRFENYCQRFELTEA